LLCAASAFLYVAGIVFNDFFDRDLDAVERPERPIPSGEVSPATALGIGVALLTGGVLLAALSSSVSGAVAAALVSAILFYDGGVKDGPLGPLTMGACRFLNVCLGLSATGGAPPESWMWVAPIALGAYTAALTALSRAEVSGTSGESAREAVLVIGAILLGALVALALASPARRLGGLVQLAPFAALVAWRARAAFGPVWTDASGPRIGRAIGGGILLMPAIDASMVAAAGWPIAALVVLGFTVPALALRRLYAMS
jgi:4-hydroxybenzoate polyprenyltransferase